ncbi:LacI family DNA-binding transcriptional regulator [Actinophytocola xanthii]|uniref:LacI family transcriptional regulator n=1 Tax=Actinophytocola xanthii TaxID=1912961 RepID=A0A1Q8CC33_9PSEU|nr:LacI family DNA-binding transcriptional regulator [Actinophytocola xanthii]OLF11896.1 LacI family transcriptional regulator [Actinophytocola xanthii]
MPTPRRAPLKRVTLEEVARAAGVSRATASRVVNGVTTVDEAIRSAVQRAIADTGYVPNPAARSLVTRRAEAVALVLPERARLPGDPFLGRLLRGTSRVTGDHGVHLVLMTMDANTRDQVAADLHRGRLDGVILVHPGERDPLPRRLVESRFPVVLSARPAEPLAVTHVEADQRAGAALAADHLRSLRRRRIVTITGPLHTAVGHDRLAGFRDTLADPDLAWVEGDFSRESGAVGMTHLVEAHPDLDAVFAASDLMAQGALSVLRARGRAVPADVAVVGFDDSGVALACDPPLTTVREPVEEMAAELARLLLHHIDHPDSPPARTLFTPTLVHRHSA